MSREVKPPKAKKEAKKPAVAGKDKKPSPKKRKAKEKPEYFLPAARTVSKSGILIGESMRGLLAALLSGALVFFLCDSFDIIALPRIGVYLLALLLAAVFVAMNQSHALYWIGLGTVGVGLTLSVLLSGNPIGLIRGMIPGAWNTAMKALENAGFQTLSYLQTGAGNLSQEALQIAFEVFLTLSFTVVIFASTYKKVRLIPLFICILTSAVPVFTYNLAYSTIEFAIIVFTVAAILVLRYYDRAMKKVNAGPYKAAFGGYIGSGAALLACVAVLVPTLTVKAEWEEIDGLNERMEAARTVLSAILVGEKPDWTQIDNLGNLDSLGSRSTIATHRAYTGREVLKVHSGMNLPMYLRSWIAHDYTDQRWTAAGAGVRENYVQIFGNDFMPEQISQDFFDIALPQSSEFSLRSDYADYSKYGFVTAAVSVEVINSTGNLLYVPARFDLERGFMVHKSNEEDYGKPYGETTDNYYDGIVSTGWLNLNKKYTTVSQLPLYREPDVAQNLTRLLQIYQANVTHMQYYQKMMEEYPGLTLSEYMSGVGMESGIDFTAFYAFAKMSDRDREDYLRRIVTQRDQYQRYVYAHYTQKHSGTVIHDVAKELVRTAKLSEGLMDSNGSNIWFYSDSSNPANGTFFPAESANASVNGLGVSFQEKFRAVMAVVDYLQSVEFTYTLTPTAPTDSLSNRNLDAAELFLVKTKEGYCVQYATAATFLLREMGIPTRYVEGYIVERLEYDDNVGERFEKYQATVRDYNAHAWIECYFDDIGWMTFEVTPPYYEVIYRPTVSKPFVPPHTPPEMPEPEVPDTPITPPKPVVPTVPLLFGFLPVDVAIGIGITLASLAVLLTLVLLIRAYFKKKKRLRQARQATVERAISADLTQEEIDALGYELTAMIEKTCRVGGLRRNRLEFASDYARRIDEALAALKDAPVLKASFAEIVPILERVNFAHTLSREELSLLGRFWLSLRDVTYERFNPFEKYWYGTVKLAV